VIEQGAAMRVKGEPGKKFRYGLSTGGLDGILLSLGRNPSMTNTENHNKGRKPVSSAIWTPDKPSAAFSEEEVRQAPDFQTLRSVMPPSISDENVAELAKNAIEARWLQIRDSRRTERLDAFVNDLRVCEPEELAKVDRIIITLSEDGNTMEFKRERAPRWNEETYAEKRGVYTKEYTSTRHPDASGEYRLDIEAGRREGEAVFMKLTQPDGRVLQFPPADPENPVGDENSDVREVTSISRLLRDSSHKTTLSVWQYFGLARDEDEGEGESE